MASIAEDGVAGPVENAAGNRPTAPIGVSGPQRWLGFAKEAFADNPVSAPVLLAKALYARLKVDIEPEVFIQKGLDKRPFRSVPDTVRYWNKLHLALQRVNWAADGGRVVQDKLATAERYQQRGIGFAPVVAVVGRDPVQFPHETLFPAPNTLSELVNVLDGAPDHLICKPAAGSRGGGVFAASRTAHGWSIEREELSRAALAERMLAMAGPDGLLVQPRLQSHPALSSIGGEFGLCSVRINTALLRTGPTIFFHFLKLMGRPGLVDNFSGGKHGNLLAAIDRDTGCITAAYCRMPGQRYLLTEVTHHPATGMPVKGTEVPMWKEAVELALRAAEATPECPLPGADIALTADGPKILEINSAWDSDYAELTEQKGIKPMLREVWPDLLADEQAKVDAAKILQL